jgi:acetyl esterase/lipase
MRARRGKHRAASLVTMPAGVPPRAVVGFFHGGGFVHGRPDQFKNMAAILVDHHIGSVSFAYRTHSEDGATVRDAVDDARRSAHELKSRYSNIPILFSGSSAGGVLAVHAALEIAADGVVLFNPALDLTKPRLRRKDVLTGGEETLSPLHMPLGAFPPALIFHGTADRVTPIEDSIFFIRRLHALGTPTDLVRFEDVGHGLLKRIPLDRLASRMIAFIDKLR